MGEEFRGGQGGPFPGNLGGLPQHWYHSSGKVIFKHFPTEGFETTDILLGDHEGIALSSAFGAEGKHMI